MQGGPVSLFDLKGQPGKNRLFRVRIPERIVPHVHQHPFVMDKGHQLQIRRLLQIHKQPFLFFDLPVDPLFHLGHAALQLPGFLPDVGSSSAMSRILYRVKADLAAFALFRPLPGPRGRLPEPADLLSVLFIFRFLKRVSAAFIFPPAGKIPALHLDGLTV